MAPGAKAPARDDYSIELARRVTAYLAETTVDTASIVQSLRNISICFVCNEEDITEHMAGVFNRYNIPFESFSSLEEMEGASASPREGMFACLVDEDIYNRETYERTRPSPSSLLLRIHIPAW